MDSQETQRGKKLTSFRKPDGAFAGALERVEFWELSNQLLNKLPTLFTLGLVHTPSKLLEFAVVHLDLVSFNEIVLTHPAKNLMVLEKRGEQLPITFFDIEITGLDPLQSKIITIQIRRNGKTIIFKEWELGESEMIESFLILLGEFAGRRRYSSVTTF